MAQKEEEFIRDFQGVIIGIVEKYPNGDKTVREFPSRRILGYYKAKFDYTTNFLGKILGKGDSAVSLIYNNKK